MEAAGEGGPEARGAYETEYLVRDVMGLKVVRDFGENVTLEGGIFLQNA